jgi:hypothetical protein
MNTRKKILIDYSPETKTFTAGTRVINFDEVIVSLTGSDASHTDYTTELTSTAQNEFDTRMRHDFLDEL